MLLNSIAIYIKKINVEYISLGLTNFVFEKT